MAIFKNQFHYDNSIISVDTAWSPSADPVLNVKFAHGPFSMDYHCLQSRFVRSFKEDFTAFYEKVMKDYDEVTGKSNGFEDCFDALLDDMTEINYRPETENNEEVKDTEEQLRARFTAYEKRIRFLEVMLCRELHNAYDMSISDISERLSIAESAVRYFIDGGE